MQSAKCTLDGVDYTAMQLTQFSEAQRAAMKGHFLCLYCGEAAFYRRATPAGSGRRAKSAHFASRRHSEICNPERDYSDPWESEDGDSTVARWEEHGKKIVVQIRIDQIATAGEDANPEDQDGRQSQSGGARTRQSPNVIRGPQRLLEQLVGWPSFKTSSLLIRLPDPQETELPIHTAFVRFEQANQDRHTTNWHGFWGVVPRLTYWAQGRLYYANFGSSNSDFRIAIHENHVPAILERHRILNIYDIVGGYILLFDAARTSTSGRFTADVNSVNHIGFLRAS